MKNELFKGAYSEIFENEFALNLQIWSLLNTSSMVKKLQISISFDSNNRK